MMKVRAVAAHTKHPNTPDSDLQLTVVCVVKLSDGSTTEVEAHDPGEAIQRTNSQLIREHIRKSYGTNQQAAPHPSLSR